MFKKIDGGAQCMDTGDKIGEDHRWWDERVLPDVAANGWYIEVPTNNERNHAIRNAAWAWMTAWVHARLYDSIESCCSYATSKVPRYAAEAACMVEWRDDVNQRLIELALAPPAGVETWEDVMPLLPQPEAYSWPEEMELPLAETTPANPDI